MSLTGVQVSSLPTKTLSTAAYTVLTNEQPVKMTVRNFDLTTIIVGNTASDFDNYAVYLMKKPQNMTNPLSFTDVGGDNASNDIANLSHPEYVLAYKYIGPAYQGDQTASTSTTLAQPTRIRSRRDVTLYPGDTICLVVAYTDPVSTGSANASIVAEGVVRYRLRLN
jgi:hypothetical protein